MYNAILYIKQHAVVSGAVALIALLAVWYLFFYHSATALETMVVKRADFVNQVSVTGTVVAAHTVDLGFAQSGRVAYTYVVVGQRVAQGVVLAEIENGDLRGALAQKQAALQSQQAQLASIEQGTRPEQVAVTESQVTSDKAALAQANQNVVNAIQSAYTTADDAIHNKIDQLLNNPRSPNPQLTFQSTNSGSLTTITSQRVTLEGLLAQWQTDTQTLTAESSLTTAEDEAQRVLQTVATLLASTNLALNSAIPSASVSQTMITNYSTLISSSRSSVDAAQSAVTTAITAQRNAAAALDKDQKTLALQKAGATTADVDAQRAQVAAAQADVVSAEAQLAKTMIVAPFTGTVTKMDAKVGEILSPNSSQISMISDGTFQVESYIPEVNIAGVAVGNPATTTLDAYGPDTHFGLTVVAINPAETVVNGVSNYKTTLQFATADPRIRSGMTANLTITTATIPNTIAIPAGAVVSRAGGSFVEVLSAGKVMERPVTLGAVSTLGMDQILSGLSDGDAVVLNPSQ